MLRPVQANLIARRIGKVTVKACASRDYLRREGRPKKAEEPLRLPDWYFDLAREAGNIMASEAYALHRDHIEDLLQPIGEAVRARILGARKLAPGEYAEGLRTMAERRRIFSEWFRRFDALLLPTVAVPAPPLEGIDEASPVPAYFTRPQNYLGLCALAMPAGLHEGLPLSIQIVGKPYAERQVLEIGKAYQDETRFNQLRPDLAGLHSA